MAEFDVIVVGAGPAGSAAAYLLAKEGCDVLVLEKARVPGHRNVTGGVLYGAYLEGYGLIDLIPDFEAEAPLERKVVAQKVFLLSQPSWRDGEGSFQLREIDEGSLLTKLGLTGLDVSTGHDWTVLRARFDRWFAQKALEQGAMLATEQTAEELIVDGGVVKGVRTARETLSANVVIDASGVTSTLVEQAGLRPRLRPEDVYHGVKHVYQLPEEEINRRFNLRDGREGVAYTFLGPFMKGVKGGAFIYTNRDTLSVGIVAGLDSLIEVCTRDFHEVGKPLDVLQEFERHPYIRPLLEGARLVEYSAHNIPKGYRVMLRRPYTHGFMAVGDALGCFVKIGALIDGIRRAIATGIMAARAYLAARDRGDFGAAGLGLYEELLKPVYEDVARSRLNSWLTEGFIAYRLMPSLIFSLGLARRHSAAKGPLPDEKDAIQRVQERTGLLSYDEDKEYSHIKVDPELASLDKKKAWVPLCPVNCYTLVTEKGVFASFRDLYLYNLASLGGRGRDAKREALLRTREDIARGQVRFDHVACVACGTCGTIGPPSVVKFGHERDGHGVRYAYG
jgi:electron transfer flavoprotein-quinone oxidoreductase